MFTRDTFTWGKCYFTIENATQYNRNVNLSQVNVSRVNTALITNANSISFAVHCRYNFTHLSGQFESPNFPHNYPDSIECYYYLIQVPFDFTITLAFSHFDLEPKYRGACRFDFIEVFDGPWPNSTLLGRFCGADLPAPVNSTFNSLLVKFVTDDSEQRTGFRINYTTSRGKR